METHLLKRQMTAAYQYSYARLVLNDYILYETLAESQDAPEESVKTAKAINALAGEFLDGKDIRKPLLALRESFMHTMEILAAYTDCLVNVEYVLNRMERRFRTLEPSPYNDETFAGLMAAYIGRSDDASMRQSSVREVLGQLPVRFTKQKFFAEILERLSVYIGSPKDSLKDIMYILNTESMAELPEGMKEEFPDYYQDLSDFLKTDYKNLDKDGYEDLDARFQRDSAAIMDRCDSGVTLSEIMNDLYVLASAREDAVWDTSEEKLYQRILTPVIKSFAAEEFPPPDPSSELLLEQLEGRQETYYEKYMRGELPTETQELLRDPDYVRLVNVDRLVSGSLFPELLKGDTSDEDGGRGPVPVLYERPEENLTDREWLERTAGEYFKKLENLFAKISKPAARAVMARVLSDLPAMFRSEEEVETYILGRLASCGDEEEKETCKELLEELIENEDNLV